MTTASEHIVSLRHVDKTFDQGTVALRDFNLDVGRHDFVSLLGPSGCGKSTALRLIAGLIEPTGGRIVRHDEAHDLDIGFVFQEPTLMPWSTVAGNIGLPLKLKNVPGPVRAAKVSEAVEMVGLQGFEESYPRELSGGMKMRVSIARALATEPDVLLMDEPFAALDEMSRFRLNDDLLRLWLDQKWTVVFVTHSVFEAVYLSNRVFIMAPRPGHIVEEIAVPAPHPRGTNYRTSAEYAAECRRVSEAMANAFDGEAEERRHG